MLPRSALAVAGLALACSARVPPILAPNQDTPHLTLPVPVAEGHGEPVPAELDETAPGAASSSVRTAPAVPKQFSNDPPDPLPLRQAEQYEYTFRYERGTLELLGVRPVRYPKPIVTARRMGRFAVELWIGHELVDRVRFDFPLLAADEPKTGPRPLGEKPGMQGGSFTTTLLVPAARRARSARLVDRALRTQGELPWPPAPAGLGPMQPMAASSAPNGQGSESSDAGHGAETPSGAAPAPSGASPASTPPAAVTPPAASSSAPTPPSSAAPPAASPARARPR